MVYLCSCLCVACAAVTCSVARVRVDGRKRQKATMAANHAGCRYNIDFCHLGGGFVGVYSSVQVVLCICGILCASFGPKNHCHHHEVVATTFYYRRPSQGWLCVCVIFFVCVCLFRYCVYICILAKIIKEIHHHHREVVPP